MLWAQGLILRRDEIGRYLMKACASLDPEAMQLARWTLRRLEGQGDFLDPAGFLGLHRGRLQEAEAEEGKLVSRPRGAAFDEAAAEFLIDLFKAAMVIAVMGFVASIALAKFLFRGEVIE